MIWRAGGARGCCWSCRCRRAAAALRRPLFARRGDGSGAGVPVPVPVPVPGLGAGRPGEQRDGAAAAAGHVSGERGRGGGSGVVVVVVVGGGPGAARCIAGVAAFVCGRAGSGAPRVSPAGRGSVRIVLQPCDKESLTGCAFDSPGLPLRRSAGL